MVKNTAQTIVFPLLDADGDPVGGATNLDSEYSLDGGVFTDCTNEATNMTSSATNTGIYSLSLVAGETNGTVVCIQVKSTEAKTTVLVFYTSTQSLDTIDTNLDSLMADVGDASGSTKGSIYGIVGNPAANTLTTTLENVHDTDLPAVKTDTGNIKTVVDDLHDTDIPDIHTDVGTRAPSATALTNATWTDARAALLDKLTNLLKIGKNKWDIVGTVFTIYDDDGTTPLYQFDLDDASAPTSRTPK